MGKSFVATLAVALILLVSLPQCTDNNSVSSYRSPSVESGWTQLNPYPTSNNLVEVQFVGDETAWAFESGGGRLLTRNGGKTWSRASSLDYTVNDVFFFDNSYGWAVCDSGRILFSRDGGERWKEQVSGTTNSLNGVTFIDRSHGWAVGRGGIILATKNAGYTWEVQRGEGSNDLFDILFFDRLEGWAVGRGYHRQGGAELLHTVDGGATWEYVNSDLPTDLGYPDSYVHSAFVGIAATDPEHIVIVGESNQWDLLGGIISISHDGGESWIHELTYQDYLDVTFSSPNDCWIIGYTDIFHSADAGVSWEPASADNRAGLYAIDFSDAHNGCAVGGTGTVVTTTDGGQNWTDITRGHREWNFDSDFIDEQRGWLCGYGGVYRTVDGGRTWIPTDSHAGEAIDFIDLMNGWATDYNGNIDRTTDGGLSWTRVANDIQTRVRDMCFATDQIGWACGWSQLMKTTDGGHTWTTQWSGAHLNNLCFLDSLQGWCVGEGGLILHTTDGGQTWTQQTSPVSSNIGYVFFVDDQHGWACGGATGVLATTDGGDNWHTQSLFGYEGTPPIAALTFADTQNGWLVGAQGLIYGTTDGGNTWLKQDNPTKSQLTNVCATDVNHVWAIGLGGAVLYTATGGR